MSYRCDLTGKGKQFGNHVSHSQRHVKRTWKPNLQPKTLIIDGKKVKLRLAASTIRTLNKYQKQIDAKELENANK
ncbi:MAG: 50S ribosomal protein L28 [Patescibacteria group bacterium]|jgi:large subunit ribosomal protein L28|nr:50S ribosomal protein L28 [Patescibacteria group bacterium]